MTFDGTNIEIDNAVGSQVHLTTEEPSSQIAEELTETVDAPAASDEPAITSNKQPAAPEQPLTPTNDEASASKISNKKQGHYKLNSSLFIEIESPFDVQKNKDRHQISQYFEEKDFACELGGGSGEVCKVGKEGSAGQELNI